MGSGQGRGREIAGGGSYKEHEARAKLEQLLQIDKVLTLEKNTP